MAVPILKGVLGTDGAAGSMTVDALGAFRHGGPDVCVAGFGNLRFLDDAYAVLQRSRGTGEALWTAWRERGDSLLPRLSGDFALACWNGPEARGLVAVDRFATHSLYWRQEAGRLAFSTRAIDVPALLGRRPEISAGAIHAYLYFHVIPAPLSICDGVARLDMGEAFSFTRQRAPATVRYWQPIFDEQRAFDFAGEKAAFFAALRAGVAESLDGCPPQEAGCFLSGGTDSSTIAGLATESLGGPARTFSIAFDVQAYDERHYSRLAAQHFGTVHTEHVLTLDEVVSGIEAVSVAYEQPFGNSSALPTWICARVAGGAGIRRMLGGDGGDELYGGNTRYATAGLLAHYTRVPAAVRSGLLEPWARRSSSRLWPLRKIRGYVDRASVPMPAQMQRFNLLNQLGVDKVVTAAMRERAQGFDPDDFERDVWHRCAASALINRLLAFDFKRTLADNDLPKVSRMCHAAGVEVAFPMLSHAVVGHSLTLLPGQKLKGMRLRHFFREALRGFLPDAIIDKPKHGFGMPFGEWLLNQPVLAKRADDALASLSARGIVQAALLQDLRQRIAGGHAGYYGTMVWVLMMLELWLRQSPFADFGVARDH